MAKNVIKTEGKKCQAYELGAGSEMELNLIKEGKICRIGNGAYELFSQESKSGSGQLANEGDYFKVDNAGYPYPNKREWFFQNHRHLKGDTYEQLPKALLAWESTDEVTPEVQFLIDNKGLKLDPENPEKYFGAKLWGAWLTAASDAVLIFYRVSYDETTGKVTDASFNFVARNEFNASYRYV